MLRCRSSATTADWMMKVPNSKENVRRDRNHMLQVPPKRPASAPTRRSQAHGRQEGHGEPLAFAHFESFSSPENFSINNRRPMPAARAHHAFDPLAARTRRRRVPQHTTRCEWARVVHSGVVGRVREGRDWLGTTSSIVGHHYGCVVFGKGPVGHYSTVGRARADVGRAR